MNKLNAALIILVFVGIAALFIKFHSDKKSSFVEIDNVKFSVDIATTKEEQAKGLAVYKSLPQDRGMFFPFQTPDYYAFWMKDMKFPIDIIFIYKNRITDIFKNVPVSKSQNEILPLYKPKSPSDGVLEINAGLAKQYNFKIGDFVKISY